jgi:outer membrane protein assembly factor BamE
LETARPAGLYKAATRIDSGSFFMLRVILMIFLLAGCKQVPMLPSLTPYKIDVQQGNYVNQQMVAKLKPGMTRAQVRFILGTPLVVDPFRTDRWDYVYLLNKRGEVTEQRRIAVIFEQDKLKRIEGDVVAASIGAVKDESGARLPAPTETKPQPGATPAKSEEKKSEPGASSSTAPAATAPAAKADEPVQSRSR